jgi:hypothetical protein
MQLYEMNTDQMNMYPLEWEGLKLTNEGWNKIQKEFYLKLLNQHRDSEYKNDDFIYPVNLILKEV